MQNNRAVGSLYEEKAAEYLKSLGYRIIERNYHAGKTGEIDIIAIDGDTYVFVECKFRKDIASGDPFEAVGKTKIRNICKCALVYMKYNHISMNNKIRFIKKNKSFKEINDVLNDERKLSKDNVRNVGSLNITF